MRRLALGGALAALLAGAGGCAGASSSSTTSGPAVGGSTLTIYTHQDASDSTAQDVIDAERLALEQTGGVVGRYKVVLRVAKGLISDNARQATADGTAVAYLGELQPHESSQSLGINNGLGLLQVSPTDTALELTQTTAAVSKSPTRYYENITSYGRTFARVVPAGDREAVALTRAMKTQQVHRLYISDDGSQYGAAIAAAVGSEARSVGLVVLTGGGPRKSTPAQRIKASGADALFVGAEVNGRAAAAKLFNAASAAVRQVKLFAASSLSNDLFAGLLSASAASAITISAPGLTGAELGPAGRKFIADFQSRFGRQPNRSAIFGYTAMACVLNALRSAGMTNENRSAVVKAMFHTVAFPTPLGSVTIDPMTGDLKGLAPFVLQQVRSGHRVVFAGLSGL